MKITVALCCLLLLVAAVDGHTISAKGGARLSL
jgi:hypothetical protein